MAHRDNSTQLKDTLLATAPRYMEKAIGWVSVLVAASLGAFGLFILFAAIVRGKTNLLGLWVLLPVPAILFYFFASVGYRLLRAKPNAVGSIASPAVWLTCTVFFGVLTLAFIAVAITKQVFAGAQGAALSALFALLSYGAASHFRRRK